LEADDGAAIQSRGKPPTRRNTTIRSAGIESEDSEEIDNGAGVGEDDTTDFAAAATR
jgi:hypothetical protein